MDDNATRDKIFKWELIRDDCDDEEMHQFLALLKRINGLMADDDDETQENERRKVSRRVKRHKTS